MPPTHTHHHVVPTPPSRDMRAIESNPSEDFAANQCRLHSRACVGRYHDLRRDFEWRRRNAPTAERLCNRCRKLSESVTRITIQDEAGKAPSTKQRRGVGYQDRASGSEQVPTADQPFRHHKEDIPHSWTSRIDTTGR